VPPRILPSTGAAAKSSIFLMNSGNPFMIDIYDILVIYLCV
jgi:hypothetical protein